MKAVTDVYLYLFFFVVIDLTFVAVISFNLVAINSPAGRAMELAITTAINIDSLSSVSEGDARIDAKDYKYDVEVQKKGGIWRILGNVLPEGWVLKEGWYVVAVPYDKDGKKKSPEYFAMNSYGSAGDDMHVSLTGVSSVCIRKEASQPLAKVVKCA
jgi:hypothetical protein